jgi:hypothetical protein
MRGQRREKGGRAWESDRNGVVSYKERILAFRLRLQLGLGGELGTRAEAEVCQSTVLTSSPSGEKSLVTPDKPTSQD